MVSEPRLNPTPSDQNNVKDSVKDNAKRANVKDSVKDNIENRES
jgi:hypothetical protein